jgi:predicted TIM-barrel fold metal-dependent hydrolase
VQEDNLEEIKRLNEIKAECNVIIDHLGELRGMVNQESFRAELHHMANRCRSKIQDANNELKKYI